MSDTSIGWMGRALPGIEGQMRFRVARQAVLASNLANVDTPGYRRADLRFEQALSDASLRTAGSHPAHEPARRAGDEGWRIETQKTARGPDGNSVDLDRETIEIGRNAGAFNQQAEVYARLLALTRTAIDGGGR